MPKLVKRATWLLNQTGALSGNNVRAVVRDIDTTPLEFFDELLVYITATPMSGGTTGVTDVYLQRAIVPNPSPTDDTHWNDLSLLGSIATGPVQFVTPLPHRDVYSASTTTTVGVPRDNTGFSSASGMARMGHWGDIIRIFERVAGDRTGPATYSVHATGVMERT
ncbi:MAG: hypothetical protein QW838_04265 [Candidatus Nitrosotenuis sp.]